MGGGAATPLRLNEIRATAVAGPQGPQIPSSVELFNSATVGVNPAGFTLSNAAGTTLAVLPSVPIPPKSFLTVVFGSGADDFDFGDASGSLYTQGDSLDVFSPASDECALYVGPPVPGNIADYVAWSSVGPYGGGFSALAASNAGIWTPNDFVDLSQNGLMSSFGLCPDGFDHDDSSDWREFDSSTGAPTS
jgi:hypothetical protein